MITCRLVSATNNQRISCAMANSGSRLSCVQRLRVGSVGNMRPSRINDGSGAVEGRPHPVLAGNEGRLAAWIERGDRFHQTSRPLFSVKRRNFGGNGRPESLQIKPLIRTDDRHAIGFKLTK